jgi:hypothetical protein
VSSIFNLTKGEIMKAVLSQTGDFVRQVEVDAIEAQPGTYRLQFSSQLATARNPDEWQRNFVLILQKQELQAFGNLITSALAK